MTLSKLLATHVNAVVKACQEAIAQADDGDVADTPISAAWPERIDADQRMRRRLCRAASLKLMATGAACYPHGERILVRV